MQRGFRMLAGVFALLLAAPAVSFLAGVALAPGMQLAKPSQGGLACSGPAVCIHPDDLALAGMLLVVAVVILSALLSANRVALRAAAAGGYSGALLAVVLVPATGRATLQLAALALFLAAGSTALLLAAQPESVPSQDTSSGEPNP